ncbi:MAG: PASTA domain-containing protein [Fibrobacteraceae bacterium]|nr:PASTA domain-containing protein [Fibrobacteraceae bacterium]
MNLDKEKLKENLKENALRARDYAHSTFETKPWVYAAFLLIVILFLCVGIFDKIVMPIVAGKLSSEIEVPNVVGLDSASAVAAIKKAGFGVAWTPDRQFSNTVEAGLVMNQVPSALRKAKPGRTIRMTVSEGLHQFSVPELYGKSAKEAEISIERAGLVFGRIIETPDPKLPKNAVVRTRPSEGSVVHGGDKVDVFISSGAHGARVLLPDVKDLSMEDAVQQLEDVGFVIGRITREKISGEESGKVLFQDPAAGDSLPAGTKINLNVVD